MSFESLAADVTCRARAASTQTSELRSDVKTRALERIAEGLMAQTPAILEANARDLQASREAGLEGPMLERLALYEARISGIASGVRNVAALPDPVGEITRMWDRPNGLQVGRMRIPLGVILIIYESRPGVTADAAALCLKSGNATILRGGKEALHSNRAIAACIRKALLESAVPEDAVQLIPDPAREIIDALLVREDEIDLVVPRGGEGLIRRVSERSRIPVIKHYKGVCHVYVDEHAEPKLARAITINSKSQRVSVCNSAETLLVHAALADTLLPQLVGELQDLGVEVRGCERTASRCPGTLPASEADWREEYLSMTLAVRVVDSIDAAIEHIREYGSDHTETIVTQNLRRAHEFVRRVNSSSVFVNASTRFADGYELGLGAEIGVSTSRLHWYGPMGIEGLTTQKFIAFGDGTLKE